MQRQDTATKKNNRRKKTKTSDNVTATLQYKPDPKSGWLGSIGHSAYTSVSTIFGLRSAPQARSDNPLLRDAKMKPENEKTTTDTKLEALHTRLEGGKGKDPHSLRSQLNTVEEKLAEARKHKQPIETLVQARRGIRKDMDLIRVEKVQLIPELIKEHANRRVDLFFYLCVLVYKTNVIVEKGSTVRQHGDGDGAVGTAACHSSLIPNPVFKPGPTLTDTAISQLPTFVRSLLSYFSSEHAAELQEDCEDLFIRDTFNMTVILPVIVNKFDNLLEGTVTNPSELVLKALEIVNRTSRGEINPLQAMDEFGAAINAYFNGQEIKYNDEILKPKDDTKNAQSLALILKYQREGTHRVIQPRTGKADRGHFFMLLDAKTYFNSTTTLHMQLFPEQYFIALQKELLNPPLHIAEVSFFEAEFYATLAKPEACEKIIDIYESYTTRANLLKDKFENGTHDDNHIKTLKNMQNNIMLLDDIVAKHSKKHQKDIKKYKHHANKSITTAAEKLEESSNKHLKPTIN